MCLGVDVMVGLSGFPSTPMIHDSVIETPAFALYLSIILPDFPSLSQWHHDPPGVSSISLPCPSRSGNCHIALILPLQGSHILSIPEATTWFKF